MGYYLTQAVYADPPKGVTWRDLVCLIYMAHSARDTEKRERTYTVPAGVYTAGWAWVAIVPLRYPAYDPTAKREVARVMQRLRDSGAITPVPQPLPHAHERAYLLNYETRPGR